MDGRFLGIRIDTFWDSIREGLPAPESPDRPLYLDEMLNRLCDEFLDTYFDYLLDLSDRQIFDRFHEEVRHRHDERPDSGRYRCLTDDELFELYRDEVRTMFSDELRKDHYADVCRNFHNGVRRGILAKLRDRYGDLPLKYPTGDSTPVTSGTPPPVPNRAVTDEGMALVDEYAELTEKIDALKRRTAMLEEKRQEVAGRLYAYSEANVYRVVEGHGYRAEIKLEKRIEMPEDRSVIVERLKRTGEYERLSTVNYSRLRSEISKGEADPEIQRLVRITKVPRITLRRRSDIHPPTRYHTSITCKSVLASWPRRSGPYSRRWSLSSVPMDSRQTSPTKCPRTPWDRTWWTGSARTATRPSTSSGSGIPRNGSPRPCCTCTAFPRPSSATL